jgi:5-methylcytosine-specific restriction endonuclease McrA
MKIITLSQAKKLNLKRYFTGKPCKRGHISERHTCNGTCIECVLSSEVHKKNCKDWIDKNRDYFNENKKIWRKNKKERGCNKETEYNKAWCLKNKEHIKQYSKKYYNKNKETIKRKREIYIKNNLEKFRIYASQRRARLNDLESNWCMKDIKNMIKMQKYKCIYCKKNIKNNFSIDHIIPISKNGSDLLENIQILCPSCNSKKHNKDPESFANENGMLI